MKKLQDKVAIITGASSGIGEATARRLSEEGAKVVLAARRTDKLAKLKAEIEAAGGEALLVPTDVTIRKDLQNLAAQALEKFGRIDILVNNAGIMPLGAMKNLRVEEWDQMIDVNLRGVLYSIAAVLPIFREQKTGHIVNISSVAGRKVYPGSAVYCATKFGVRAVSEGLRMELSASDNIRVTVVEPGAVETELSASIKDPETLQWFSSWATSAKRLEAKDIAESIAYAVSQPAHVNVDEIMLTSRERSP